MKIRNIRNYSWVMWFLVLPTLLITHASNFLVRVLNSTLPRCDVKNNPELTFAQPQWFTWLNWALWSITDFFYRPVEAYLNWFTFADVTSLKVLVYQGSPVPADPRLDVCLAMQIQDESQLVGQNVVAVENKPDHQAFAGARTRMLARTGKETFI